MSEYSSRLSRGAFVSAVFAQQARPAPRPKGQSNHRNFVQSLCPLLQQ